MLLALIFGLAIWSGCVTAATKRLHSSAFGIAGRDAAYDYIVVGGGTAGLTIAARLAESFSVAVVEAGGYYEVENGNNSVVPLLSLTGIDFIDTSEAFPRRPLMDWELLSVPQAGAANRQIHYAQGKTLGGSSAINTLSYLRSAKGAYQKWADTVGDDSYTFENLLPYYKKSVHLTPPNLAKRAAANATPEYDPAAFDAGGGPLQVSWNNWVDPTITWLAKSLQAIGLPVNPKNFQSGELAGGAWLPSTIDPEHATRSSSQSSFLEDAIENTQITVYTHSQVSKILFNGTVATGVNVSAQGVDYTLTAKNEIIISAGVFHSPQLLMLSGIGSPSLLQTHAIPPIAPLPGVGANLIDPLSINILNFISTPNAQSIIANPSTEPAALNQYLANATGPYTSAAGYISYERLPARLRQTLSNSTQKALEAFPEDWPEVQYIVGTFLWPNGSSVGAISATNLVTLARGNVSISSGSIADAPVIDLGWFADPADGEVLVAGVKRAREAWGSETARSIRIGEDYSPPANVTRDEDILDFLKANAGTIWHATGTCAMGKRDDEFAVVDSKARVIGVEGLRVVDGSIFPFALPGHPQSSVYMVAEKIADDILRAL